MRGRAVSRRDATLCAVAVLAGAVLVFQIQPIVGKLLLPAFGGGAAVWITCMFFFQAMLLAGYGYTHVLTNSLHPHRQALVHAGLLALSAVFLPVSTAAEGADATAANPAGAILLVLLATIGMPFVMLASTAPLIQRWSTLTRPARAPWSLYALSNAGALAALLSYPFLVEPHMALRAQTLAWSAGYVVFLAVSLAACRMLWTRHATQADTATTANAATDTERQIMPAVAALYVLLAACGVALLLAVTNQITQNIAPVPFLWILPLVVYLLTWIVCFSGERWYDRAVWGSLLIVAGSTLIILQFFGAAFPVVPSVMAWLLSLFCLCMVCHGELYRLRPQPRQLSLYYLLIAFGGAAGGALVSLAAPAVFVRYWEGLVAAYVLYLAFGLLVLRRSGSQGLAPSRVSPLQAAVERWSRRLFAGAWAMGVLVFPAIVAVLDALRPEYDVASTRNFYGVINVRDITDDADPPRRVLIDGTTIHGFQLLEEDRRMQPTSYYGRRTGIGLVMEGMQRSHAGLRAGVVGLGTGTLAAWGRPGDEYRFYELNPAVVELARTHFTFLRDSPATVNVVVGDGRISLERELEQVGSRNFDLLVVDAFTSGAIPVHLLTREALQIYLAHLEPHGVLAFHVTNSYVDLSPVIANLASVFDRRALLVTTVIDTGVSSRSEWVLLVEGEWIPGVEIPENVVSAPLPPPDVERIWTDDYSDLLNTLRP